MLSAYRSWAAVFWPFAPASMLRAAGAWALMRLFLYLGAGAPATEPLLVAATLLWLFAFATAAAVIEARRRYELIFLANCGVGPAFVVTFAAATVLVLEIVLAMVLW